MSSIASREPGMEGMKCAQRSQLGVGEGGGLPIKIYVFCCESLLRS